LDLDLADHCAIWRDGLTQGVRRFARPFVQRVQEPTGLRAFVTGPGSPAWVPIGQISPYVADAVVSREDGGFYAHHGFNLREIRGAIVRDVGAHRFVYGASTITMQLAKNVFLRREKTLVRKLQEVVMAWYLERSLDKDSILELYLNVVEFGPGIYGIGPASRFFFGREPADLTPLQSIYLATLLPNPTARYGNFVRGAVSPGTLASLRAIARSMVAQGRLTPAEGAAAQQEALTFRAASAPVQGALTMNVDPSTTDVAAEEMSAVHRRRANMAEHAPAAHEQSAEEPGTDGDAEPASAPDMTPVSLRTGGTI
jgi:membrane peptidoglycan carboxypeptidase